MADRPRGDADRLIVAEIAGAAGRHARRADLTDDATAAAVTELRDIAGNRPDLLAEDSEGKIIRREERRNERRPAGPEDMGQVWTERV